MRSMMTEAKSASIGARLPLDLPSPQQGAVRLEAIGLMTAGIVHDLGNTIHVLSGTLEVLDQHPAIKSSKELQPAVDCACRSLERARATIKQILSIAREDETKYDTVDLAICLSALEQPLRWIGNSKMRVKIDVDPVAPRIVCDRGNLENAILNLALNARDAIPTAGVLSIVVSTRRVRGIATELVLRVSDTGKGMSPETISRAFDAFFSTKTGVGGNGLGLTMVRRFAEDLGGNVTIESRLGVGTTVTLRIPVRSETRRRDKERRMRHVGDTSRQKASGRRSLVDDSRMLR
ncbi:ATP-binding protein [Xanthobacteraceae bacterium Astr-EGSB]|uniref:sensor histidine kinase n=1 Tax=Astrobacterium formosum TaxID=3069710 RepID=UPI0027B6D453|nr:ATP-binding protein [Xanthobacteraceae bacterium Astr-EGSB]